MWKEVIKTILPPTDGETPLIKSGVGPRNVPGGSANHQGLDISYSRGGGGVISKKPLIYSPVAGEVLISGGGTMNGVTIKGDDGMIHRFIHNSEVLVHVGKRVSVGTPIARVGARGAKTGQPHVHYEVRSAAWPNGTVFDPVAYWDGKKEVYTAPSVPADKKENPHADNPKLFKTEAGADPIPETPQHVLDQGSAQPSGKIEDYEPRQAGQAYLSGIGVALWTNRVPQHEPWPRTMMVDTDQINTATDEHNRNTRHKPQYSEDHRDVGRVEGDEINERGPFWRR